MVKQRPCRNSFLAWFSCSSHSVFLGGFFVFFLIPTHQLSFKKMCHRVAHWPICWEHFLNWSPLFPNVSGPCEVKPKLASMFLLIQLLFWILQVSWPTGFLGNLYPHLASCCRSWNYRCVPAHWLSTWVLGSKLKSSGFCGTMFIHWAIYQPTVTS